MRAPDLIIGDPKNPVYYRWQLFKIRGFQLCLHKWMRSDDDRALHDHQGDSISFILNGGYTEIVRHTWMWPGWDGIYRNTQDVPHWRHMWWPIYRKAETPHRVVLRWDSAPVWSLWFRWPPRREWGFHCPKGWKHWKDFLNSRGDYYAAGTSETGKGCGE